MTMKKRIFLSNTIMVLLSLLILFGVASACVGLFKEEIMNVVEQNAELPDTMTDVEKILQGQQTKPTTWELLSETLSDYKFELYVSDAKHKQVYSNLRHSEMECVEELEHGELASDKIKLYSMEGVAIARCVVPLTDGNYNVYATYYPKEHSLWGIDRGVFEMFVIVFIIAGIIIIAGLLLCCQLFTKFMIKRIMQPVEELHQAAARVKDGNLDEPIVYAAHDEFEEVCNTFNEMQSNLKAGMEKNAKYEKARTEMVSGISHDLRTPLTSVKGFIKGMLDGVANTPEKKEQYLKISYQKACDMEVLLQKLFFFSKLETGNMPIFVKRIELGSWVETYVDQKQLESEEKGYEIEADRVDAACFSRIDSEQMKRVLDNLLENSLKYAGIKPLRIRISVEKQDGQVQVHFADNGVGIAEEKLPHVFEQFYRGDEARNSKNDGSGLGLYVCKYIVEQQGGTVRAYNEHGFVVEMTFPEAEKEERMNTDGEDIDRRR